MSRIMAIDPGPENSAYLVLTDGWPAAFGIVPNTELQKRLEAHAYDQLVIESVESYGMPVGRDVFETCIWIGRLDPTKEARLLPRREVKLHLCNSARAKDAHIRQALIDRFGPGREKAIGKKAAPGPLYGIKTHIWSALALAVTFYDLQVREESPTMAQERVLR